jgi:hypothetical protein
MTEFDEFIEAVLRIAPGVGERLEVRGDGVEPDLEIPVLWMAFVGRALSVTLDELSGPQQRAVFDVIERHLVNGSDLMKDAVATGLLEALASEVSDGRLDGPHLATLLGPESRAYIDAWDQFTLGRSSLDPS